MKVSLGERVFNITNNLLMLCIAIVMVSPFIILLAMSFSSEGAIISGKVFLMPVGFTTSAYKLVMTNADFWGGYKNTIIQSALGTAIGLTMTTICAYPLSKSEIPGVKLITKLILFTMFFSGGLIPNYLLIVGLNLKDSLGAIVLPGAISVWNLIVMKTFFKGISQTLEDAAKIDGLNPWGILLKIVIPLSKPIIATISLFIFVYYWNSWFAQMIYLDSNDKYPVTLFLRNIINGSLALSKSGNVKAEDLANIPAESLKSASIILVAAPILCSYPFIQKYFVSGMMIGSIKE